MKKYKVSTGEVRIIEANSPEEAIEKFDEMVNECTCNHPYVQEIFKKRIIREKGSASIIRRPSRFRKRKGSL